MKSKQFTSVDSWERKSTGTWTGGVSSSLEPGSKMASTKRRQKTSHARGKKVIRPRVRKYHNPDKKQNTGDNITMAKKILTPEGSPMDYKVQKLKAKTSEDKIREELKAKADASAKKKARAKKKAK